MMGLINIEVMLVALSITFILQFCILEAIGVFLKKFIQVKCIVALEKFMLLFLCVPAICISIYIFQLNDNVNQAVLGMDFSLLKIVKKENFNALNQRYMLFTIITAVIWLVGFVVCFLVINIRDGKKLRELKEFSCMMDESDFLYFTKKELEQELKINKNIEMYWCDFIDSPFITGIIKPIIFVPTMEYPEDILRLMIKHELYHYKNKDLFFRKIAVFIKGIYWFNPFVGYFVSKFFNNCEMLSDTQTLHNESKVNRVKYVHTIVDMIGNRGGLRSVSEFMGNDANNIKKRMENIMKIRTKQHKIATMLLSAVIVLASPATAYVSAEAATALQDGCVRSISYENSESETYEYYYEKSIERTEIANYAGRSVVIGADTRGSNLIDVTINNRTRAVIEDVTFKKGDTVQYVLAGVNDTDSFRAGITDNMGNSVYVNSINGTINYTFTIKADGIYDLYMLGNTSSYVNLTGSIRI